MVPQRCHSDSLVIDRRHNSLAERKPFVGLLIFVTLTLWLKFLLHSLVGWVSATAFVDRGLPAMTRDECP